MGPIEPHTRAECHGCDRIYHLNSRTDLPGRDCGIVTLSHFGLGLVYLCNDCEEKESQPPNNLDDILTLEEAAAFTGQAGTELIEAAEAGRIRHRNAGGVYLFQRADLTGHVRLPHQG